MNSIVNIFNRYEDSRDLHSFPTRRSSDLGVAGVRAPRLAHLEEAGARLRQHVLVDARSEEHTSELQSQSNLVCRLLLEKKNIANLNIHSRYVETFEFGNMRWKHLIVVTGK